MAIERRDPIPAGWYTQMVPHKAVECFLAWVKANPSVRIARAEEAETVELVLYQLTADTPRWKVGTPDDPTACQAGLPDTAQGPATDPGAVYNSPGTQYGGVWDDLFGGGGSGNKGGSIIPGWVWIGGAVGLGLGIYAWVKP